MAYGFLVYDSASRIISDSRVDMNLRKYPLISVTLNNGANTNVTLTGLTSGTDLIANWLFGITSQDLVVTYDNYGRAKALPATSFVSTNTLKITDERSTNSSTTYQGSVVYNLQPYFVNKGG
tara:strand:+ start:2419 stop:2784 length:366 start_codon:yes stop_codon:yes gene_type:complete